MNALEKRLKRNIRLVGYGKRRNEALRKSFLNSNEDALLLDSARSASSKAIRSSKALGITIKVIRGNKIIAISKERNDFRTEITCQIQD
ncbi:MAG: hypothetical protein IPL12_02120 [Bacteroidetes bacterium]|nr:hypothetical protein [Bacteroidota bacterium]